MNILGRVVDIPRVLDSYQMPSAASGRPPTLIARFRWTLRRVALELETLGLLDEEGEDRTIAQVMVEALAWETGPGPGA